MKNWQQTLYRLAVIIAALAALTMIGKEQIGAAIKHQQSAPKMVLLK